MPVQIPSLERTSVEAQRPVQSVPIVTDVADQSKATGDIAQAGSSLVNEVNDYMVKVQEHKDELDASNVANTVDAKVRMQLGQISKMDGDTTQQYIDLENSKKQWLNDELAARPNASPRLQQAIQEKWQIRNYMLNDRAATQQGVQFEKYQNKVHDSTAELTGQGMLDAAGMIDASKPESMDSLQFSVDAAKKNRIEQGLATGTVVKNADGSLNLSPITKAQILTDLSKHLTNVVKTLNATGKTDEAQMVMDKFGEDMKGDDKAKLLTDHKESVIKKEAAMIVGNIMTKNKTVEDQVKAIDKIPYSETQAKAREMLATQVRQTEQFKTAAGKDLTDKTSKYVATGIAQGKWADLNAFREDPVIKNTATNKNVNQKQVESLEQQFQSPKYSDPKATDKLWKEIKDGTFKDNTVEDLNYKLRGTNESFRNMMTKKLSAEQSPTGAQNASIINSAHRKLDEVLLQEAASGKNSLGLEMAFGGEKLAPGEASKWHSKLDADISQMPEGLAAIKDPLKRNQYINDYITDAKKNAIFDPAAVAKRQEPYRFKSSAKPQSATPTTPADVQAPPPTAQLPPVSSADRTAWGKKFYMVNKRPFDPSKGDNMDAFRRSQGDKL